MVTWVIVYLLIGMGSFVVFHSTWAYRDHVQHYKWAIIVSIMTFVLFWPVVLGILGLVGVVVLLLCLAGTVLFRDVEKEEKDKLK